MSANFSLSRGLRIPLAGEPEQQVHAGPPVRTVALVGLDYLHLRPAMQVREGDAVRLGQCLFEHKRIPGVRFTAPGTGTVTAINRGRQRALQSVVITLAENEPPAPMGPTYSADALAGLSREEVTSRLADVGLWLALRTRPFSKIPAPGTEPAAIFVTAMDSNPLSPDPSVIIGGAAESFSMGLRALTRLTDGSVYVCHAPAASLDLPPGEQIKPATFAGPHPAGLAGTHIHFLEPVALDRSVWTIGYQDVIAFGRLFAEGIYSTERIISLAGPQVTRPRLLRTRLGAAIDDLLVEDEPEVESRVVSGSPLSGRRAAGWAAYLGRYHNQLSILAEGREREFFGWLRPGRDKFSATRVFISKLFSSQRKFPLTTSQQGSARAMVPIGIYESVMPQDLLPTQLLRSLLVRDTDMAQKLGCLELDEEDVALCSFVCPGKYDYGPALRASLEMIEKDG